MLEATAGRVLKILQTNLRHEWSTALQQVTNFYEFISFRRHHTAAYFDSSRGNLPGPVRVDRLGHTGISQNAGDICGQYTKLIGVPFQDRNQNALRTTSL